MEDICRKIKAYGFNFTYMVDNESMVDELREKFPTANILYRHIDGIRRTAFNSDCLDRNCMIVSKENMTIKLRRMCNYLIVY